MGATAYANILSTTNLILRHYAQIPTLEKLVTDLMLQPDDIVYL